MRRQPAAEDATPTPAPVKAPSAPEPTYEELLTASLEEARVLYLEARFAKAQVLLSRRLDEGSLSREERIQRLQSDDGSLIYQALSLELRARVGALITTSFERDLYGVEGSRVTVETAAKERFIGWIREPYAGAADVESVPTVKLRRLDGEPRDYAKEEVKYRRLEESRWLELIGKEVKSRAAASQPILPSTAFELTRLCVKWGAFSLAARWLDKTLALPESEILITLHGEAPRSLLEALKAELALLTKGRSRIKKVTMPAPAAVSKKGPSLTRPEIAQKVPNKASPATKPPARLLERKPTSTREGQTAGTNSLPTPAPILSATPDQNQVLELYKRARKSYQSAAKRRPGQRRQAGLREAKAQLDATLDAFNKLADADPTQATALEGTISEASKLLLDCIKQLKVKGS